MMRTPRTPDSTSPNQIKKKIMASMRLARWLVISASLLIWATPALAQKKYDIGASDTEIKVGNIMPYSGPLSAYATIGKTIAAYFNKVNTEGGINGRKIVFISYDDAFSPPKTVEQARKLVESDGVLLVFQSLGTSTNAAIRRYMNVNKVPHLFVATGATKFGDPADYPWTMGWQPTYLAEGRVYARYLLQHYSTGKIGILFQNDDAGREYVEGFKQGLAGKMKIVAEVPYEPTDPTVDSQIVTLKASGADILFNQSTPKFTAQAIKKIAEIKWKPVHLVSSVSNSVGSVFKPAGFENARGILSSNYTKDPTNPLWRNDPALKEWLKFMDTYYPEGDKTTTFAVYGYLTAQTLVQVLKQCGDELTRENVMKQAKNLKDFHLDMLLPGVMINTGGDDYFPIEEMQMSRFNGIYSEQFGPILSGK